MDRRALSRILAFAAALAAGRADAQFFEGFDTPAAAAGWEFFSGDGQATVQFAPGGDAYASILVDATRDRRNV